MRKAGDRHRSQCLLQALPTCYQGEYAWLRVGSQSGLINLPYSWIFGHACAAYIYPRHSAGCCRPCQRADGLVTNEHPAALPHVLPHSQARPHAGHSGAHTGHRSPQHIFVMSSRSHADREVPMEPCLVACGASVSRHRHTARWACGTSGCCRAPPCGTGRPRRACCGPCGGPPGRSWPPRTATTAACTAPGRRNIASVTSPAHHMSHTLASPSFVAALHPSRSR